MDHIYKCKTIKLLEENRGISLWLVVRQRVLRHDIKKTIHTRKMDQLDFVRIKNFCYVKDTILRMERLVTYCEKILKNHIFHKGLHI